MDLPTSALKESMESNYFSSAYCAHAFLQPWLQNRSATPSKNQEPKHLIFTSSIITFFSLAGYTPYTPPKQALRGLHDTLRQELLLYQALCPIKISTVFPGTIYSPSLEIENSTKPAVTKKLEENDDGQTPDEVAATSVRALEKGEELVTSGLLARAMKSGMLGNSVRQGLGVLDTMFSWVVAIVIVVVRRDMDGTVKKWGSERLVKRET